MQLRRCEDGFTLIEMLVVTAIVAIVAGTLGTFFLAGASPAVASAGRDVTAAFDEARRTAIAFDAATLVFAPARSGTGYSARIYARMPGDPAFAPRDGPTYDSTVAISETASPLGAPGFAFTIDVLGNVSGYAGFDPSATSFSSRPCPASGAFTLQLTYERDVRIVQIPCRLDPSSTAPLVLETPAAGFTPTPAPIPACPNGVACTLALLGPAALPPAPPTAIPTANPTSNPTAPPPGTPPPALPSANPTANPTAAPTSATPSAPLPAASDPVIPQSTPAANPTPCPAGFSGSPPGCAGQIIEQYEAAADGSGPHTSTLFANGSICDDFGCSTFGPIGWNWGCAFGARSGSNGTDGNNAPYQPDNAYDQSVSSMIGAADQDASVGDGHVTTSDSYCSGFPVPNP